MQQLRILAATGMLGNGFLEASLAAAIESGLDVIGCDAGSNDFGPYYLGSGKSQPSLAAYRRDLELILKAAVPRRIPVLIGSAGTAGGNPHVERTVRLVQEIAQQENLQFRLGVIKAEVSKEYLRQKLHRGEILPLDPAPDLDEEVIDRSSRFVAMMGTEPYIAALEGGATVVIAGRSTDSSIYASVPIMRGFPKGAAWHVGKLLECGTGCTEHRYAPDCMVATINSDYFVVEPPNPRMRCTPLSVRSHNLYESASVYEVVEPGGTLDMKDCKYEFHGERGVRVEGSLFRETTPYTVRLEGAEKIGHRAVTIAAVRDPVIIGQLDAFLTDVRLSTLEKVRASLGKEESKDFRLRFLAYGKDGVMGELEPHRQTPGHEVCIAVEVIAPTFEDARSVLTLAWYMGLHAPVPEWHGMVTNFAFPFSPPEMDGGEAFRFCANHVLKLEDPLEAFQIEMRDV